MNDKPHYVNIDYTNWRGERRVRKIKPHYIDFTSNEYHEVPQWLLRAYDLESHKMKWFSMQNIHSWRSDEIP